MKGIQNIERWSPEWLSIQASAEAFIDKNHIKKPESAEKGIIALQVKEISTLLLNSPDKSNTFKAERMTTILIDDLESGELDLGFIYTREVMKVVGKLLGLMDLPRSICQFQIPMITKF